MNDDMRAWERLEGQLLALMQGQHSSLHITCNDENGPNYESVETCLERNGFDHADWVSEDSKRRAVETNRAWIVHWYPNTPVSFNAVAAATLGEALAAALGGDAEKPKEPHAHR